MKKQLLFIHSADLQSPTEGNGFLTRYIIHSLEKEYELRCPLVPEPEHPKYTLWEKTVIHLPELTHAIKSLKNDKRVAH